jgi:DNA repair exonuclease SbcCD ATPase subunit
MLKLKNVTAKNFLSIGNVTQSVNLDRSDLTLILGENLDLGGNDAGSRNGTGKSALLNIVSYALFGQALVNIKKDNLINRTNGKNMLVTIDFESNGVSYRIERGRKPNIMKFFVAGTEQQIQDESQGDSRETQAEIEHILSMSHTMFKHIVALNTYTEPFLSMKAHEQRELIEQLLGITLLSEKAELLKEKIRQTKDSIQQEEYRIRGVIDANKKIQEQIEALERRQKLWARKHQEDLVSLITAYDQLNSIDIDAEIQAHKDLDAYNRRKDEISEVNRNIKQLNLDLSKELKSKTKLETDITSLREHKCHSCGQAWHNQQQETMLANKLTDLATCTSNITSFQDQIAQLNLVLKEIGELGVKPQVSYDEESQAVEHRATLANLAVSIKNKQLEVDPYSEQIEDMRKTSIEELNYDAINNLSQLRDHEEFLLKLLTNKDSFIRKKIIDQNLNYLNIRLGYYLERIGLPHQVQFQNDLTVSITELGRDLDFDNLSRGERNRLILSLSWAFRDVWENLYKKINLLFVDELMDSGLDASGMESSLAILKKFTRDQQRSVWLVSHRDELNSRVENTLRVTKSNGFTEYSCSD